MIKKFTFRSHHRVFINFSMLTPTQCQCCSGEHLSIVVDLKRCYRNIRNELMNDTTLRVPGLNCIINENLNHMRIATIVHLFGTCRLVPVSLCAHFKHAITISPYNKDV